MEKNKNSKNYHGVLILSKNKTFGRHKNGNFLYKVVSYDKEIPYFLVPYKLKIEFSKIFINNFISFTFSYQIPNQPPVGIITNNFGDIDKLKNLYEYKSSIYRNLAVNPNDKKLKTLIICDTIHDRIYEKMSIENRTKTIIFSIDGKDTIDFDDALSFDIEKKQISIYIPNVALIIDFLQLWNKIGSNAASIYFQHKKISMLPQNLSNCCSLINGKNRIAFVIDIFYNENYLITEVKLSNALIKVRKNYIYESIELLENQNYKDLFNLSKKISENNSINGVAFNGIQDSKNVIEYFMNLTNKECAKKMATLQSGIFRVTKDTPSSPPCDFLKLRSFYTGFNETIDAVNCYTHITSPIRRVVDLLNLINMSSDILSQSAKDYYLEFIENIDKINADMKEIKKIQNDCFILHYCETNPDVLDEELIGYVFDKKTNDNGMTEYLVYLPKIKFISKIIMANDTPLEYENKYKLIIFNCEENLMKKIRIIIS